MGGPGRLARSDTNKRNFACFVLAIAKLTGVGKFQPLALHIASAKLATAARSQDPRDGKIEKGKRQSNKVRKPDHGWSAGDLTGPDWTRNSAPEAATTTTNRMAVVLTCLGLRLSN